jgi:hypothetical protein
MFLARNFRYYIRRSGLICGIFPEVALSNGEEFGRTINFRVGVVVQIKPPLMLAEQKHVCSNDCGRCSGS